MERVMALSSSTSARRRGGVSQWALAWRRFKKNKAAVAGLFIVGFFGFMAAFDRIVALYPPNCIIGAGCPPGSLDYRPNAPPSLTNPFGRDLDGYDVYSQVVYGARSAFFVGFGAAGISMAISVLIALAAGYYGGVIDNVLMRLTEVFLVLPFLLILLVFLKVFVQLNPSGTGGLLIVVAIIGVLSWPGNARIIRGEALRIRELDFVSASRQIGASGSRILFRHLLPNTLHIIIVLTTLQVAGSILTEAGISFLR